MKIHEYQAKQILKKYGVPIPKGDVAFNVADAKKIAEDLGGKVVIKAQIHAGGRGKGGGVKLANSVADAEDSAKKIIGMNLVTHQTAPQGKKVKCVLVEEAMEIEKELYLGIVVDRSQGCPVIMVSEAGGMEIEEIAQKDPKKIIKEYIDPSVGLQGFQVRKLAYSLNLDKSATKNASTLISGLYKVFINEDCSLTEVNPLVVTKDSRVLALDAKINFDDNALYRHSEVVNLRDLDEEDPLEVEASKYKLSYIKLDGNVGCMVNGAGLAMATMDLIKLAGGEPANFLDVGGGANVDTIRNGFKIIMSDNNVKAILINIFGGIVRCDLVAQGVIEAVSQIKVNLPIVVRLEGTNSKEARELLKSSSLDFKIAESFEDSAKKVMELL